MLYDCTRTVCCNTAQDVIGFGSYSFHLVPLHGEDTTLSDISLNGMDNDAWAISLRLGVLHDLFQ